MRLVSILSETQGLEALRNNKFGNEKLLLLFTNPLSIVKLIAGGVTIGKVNIGGMGFSQGKLQLTQAISVDENDKEAFKRLNEYGVLLQIQILPSDTPIDIMTKL
jgi:PTS system sorbose-specific IIB component